MPLGNPPRSLRIVQLQEGGHLNVSKAIFTLLFWENGGSSGNSSESGGIFPTSQLPNRRRLAGLAMVSQASSLTPTRRLNWLASLRHLTVMTPAEPRPSVTEGAWDQICTFRTIPGLQISTRNGQMPRLIPIIGPQTVGKARLDGGVSLRGPTRVPNTVGLSFSALTLIAHLTSDSSYKI